MVVRSSTNPDGSHNADDKLIEHQNASLYSYIRQGLLQDDKTSHTKNLAELHKHRFIVDPKLNEDYKTKNGHVCARYKLTSRTKMQSSCNARQYSVRFYNNVWCKEQQGQPSSFNLNV